MSKSQTLRALVNERLTAAAEEIFALFERTIAEYEEEVCRSKEENQRKQEILDSMLSPSKSPGPGLDQDPPQTPRIKEEPEEPSVLVQDSVGAPESSAVCVKTEESSLLQQRQTELREETEGEDISTEPHLHSCDTDNDKEWRARFSCSAAQMETDADGDQYYQVQKGQRLRALVKEIFALFERTIMKYEEEVCHSKEENQRKQVLLDSALSPSKSPGPDPPQSPWIKEEPEELSVKQEEHTHLVKDLVGVPEFSAVWVKTEESSLLQQRQTELREETQEEDICTETHLHSETRGDTDLSSDTENDDDWGAPSSCSALQMETDADGDQYNQVQEGQRLKVLVKEQLTVTAEETHLNQDTSQTSRNKEEPEELNVKQEEQQLSVGVPESSAVCVETEESSPLQERQTELREERTWRGHAKKPFSCSTCRKIFATKGSLAQHVKMHLGEKPYSCPTCEKKFFQKCYLNKHVRTHTGERPYSCSMCEKTFSRKDNLDVHERTHTGERPYSCSSCDKTFSEQSSLVKHVRTHTGERPYSCLSCNKTFFTKSNLVRHMRTHTGERPYKCSMCEKTFSDNSCFIKHVRTHTGEKPYSCSICNKGFTQAHHLNKHLRTHRTESA